MLAKEDAINQALKYASSRLGIVGSRSIGESANEQGQWNVSIVGKQEEELIMVTVELTVLVYEDANGEAKCRLLMAPKKADFDDEVIPEDFFGSMPVEKRPSSEEKDLSFPEQLPS